MWRHSVTNSPPSPSSSTEDTQEGGLEADAAAHRIAAWAPFLFADYRLFWSAGTAFGTLTRTGAEVTLAVISGTLTCQTFIIHGDAHMIAKPMHAGGLLTVSVS